MTIKEVLSQPEGRRLEFKAELPENSDLAKTIVAFANDAGGELYIGVNDIPRSVIGLDEDKLIAMEEKISNTIFDRCYPAILPEIKFISENDKRLIQVTIFRGSTPPYYLKEKGKLQGTYIRVGSTNRLADETIIAELERRKRNISFDSEIIPEKTLTELNIDSFKRIFKEKAGEELTVQVLRKFELIKEVQGVEYPTNALILFSDDPLRNSMFHYAKIECARFKGVSSEVFIDQKSITANISIQAEDAYNFILRHINQGATVEGVYTVQRWEYPVKAIREAIRNAVVHRDYSLTGKDVKVAVYDDMIEITSPGLLLPSIDYTAMESRQSDARNKIIAPVFKRLGIIDQLGNGLKLIASELKEYPNIELRWKEVGLSFQIQFVKLDYLEKQERTDSIRQELLKSTLYSEVLRCLVHNTLSRQSISIALGQKKVSGQLNKIVQKLITDCLIERTIPDKPNHPAQKFQLTERGRMFLGLLDNKI
ncbi:RNA-binding domain-containing protein [Parabacteroides bouchesdurhonensis]|uniref:RNA-binding domain-containing protein n=1 Tax=Parabacteroides bouchesdurhonensis TaxID=1936995 RepID=UPI000C8402DC|nr:RNA-binding domain-containing protein [Parabacteroides bouchesdurhonensis]